MKGRNIAPIARKPNKKQRWAENANCDAYNSICHSNSRQAIQKFKIGRGVWLKTDTDGSYPMTVSDARHLPGSNTWEYELKDSMGAIHDEWVAETKLKASSSSSKKK